ncbi:hypothetical protein CMI37_38725 [Candidatus Pacearchaeota archaeon]|nr:hypothetical protein [Candidatus Pacearchaeota archaeon]|tara:strand:+ start:246 stop:629 length:384 start_codon:yes stop_codon:yes gene_type:complete
MKKLKKWRRLAIMAVGGLAILVNSVTSPGCTSEYNKPYLINNTNAFSLRAYDRDGIKYFRIIDEKRNVVYDTRKSSKFKGLGAKGSPKSTGIQTLIPKPDVNDPDNKYSLEIYDLKNNMTRIEEKTD